MMNIQLTPIVKQLLIANIIFFIGSFLVPAAQSLFALYYFENPNFQIWQPLTSMFMHGGITHILFNMFALVSFGTFLEYVFGGKRFLAFYILSGLGASILHLVVNYYQVHQAVDLLVLNGFSKTEIYELLNKGMYNTGWMTVLSQEKLNALNMAFHTPAVGASGAIYGLLVAFAFMAPNAGLSLLFIPVPIKAKYFVPGLLLIDLYLGVTGGGAIFGGSTGIAHFAHLGGALAGFVLMMNFRKRQFDQNRWD
ncbi:rhomboid family intramembrane serine protease [Capnocytophaga sp. ARDL2]|uniref:rhomboid family intramembrane serine protease n=1 Tax=Capnocytophaga sp. ARDL2 TaxID=3238809 RepID=UPI0035574425